jgi:broad-specificity NMP kinase
LYINGHDEDADSLITKIKSAKMIATKWLMQTQVITVVEWITSDLMPSDLDAPKTTQAKKK